ncbi:type I glyceraldehyde-3-phosphate dehydrogenase [Candidatus Sulfidibacterium hydrothermale]|uniref:type I glyceraldehyde-3-phosphate dehydrogenase n=1 Tax=Candidatus Sulfidibacterium hydrothermale TaxID=2875962 RepID=UPI001F0B16A0|nr:type I glyceraldehyde-3-phosphate dehydrogenase [Candidatus Sulfidibacterium hydrothermale]UBM61267.1 type I glyceraldehyde-3-phosphate dehydrogenase [Candidatus Sulfidibacterium hydrothermale]
MNKIRIAINGFGRIGRITFRNLQKKENMEVVAINDLTDTANLAHLLKYDSVHGPFRGTVQHTEKALIVNDNQILVFNEPDPSKLPWEKLKIDVVIESTGQFVERDKAILHVEKSGARKVIISAPAKGERENVKYVVLGVNDQIIDKKDVIISNASCTTNNVAPLIMILDELWGIEKGFMTTVHSYTKDQNIVDGPHKDWRRGRAAAYSIVPTTTGAAKASTRIFPHLKNNLGGAGIRVPVPDGSLTDLTCTLRKSTSVEEINAAFKEAAQGRLKGILQYTEDPIVSADIIGNTHSAVFDANLTAVLGDKHKLVKVVAWYDNEMGYSSRLVELIEKFV